MINWISCLKAIKCDFENFAGGTGEYEDPVFGLQEFLWQSYSSSVEITWFDSEPICICGKGFMDVECNCEWDWFQESEPLIKSFTKIQYQKLTAPNLFDK